MSHESKLQLFFTRVHWVTVDLVLTALSVVLAVAVARVKRTPAGTHANDGSMQRTCSPHGIRENTR